MANEDKIDRLKEIDDLAQQISRTSPSGAETIVTQIREHVAALRKEGGPDRVFAQRHERLADDGSVVAGRPVVAETEHPRSGVALPVGMSVTDRSEDGSQPPVPVAPAAPQDVDAALQSGQSVASPVVVSRPTVQPGLSGDAARNAEAAKGEQREDAKEQAERDRLERERAASVERERLSRVAPDHQTPNADTPFTPPPGVSQAERDRVDAEQKRLADQQAAINNPPRAPGVRHGPTVTAEPRKPA